jgi:PTS system galactitol-specific IIC component
VLSIVAAALDFIITIKIADWTTPVVEDYFELEGVNFPTSNSSIGARCLCAEQTFDVIPALTN